MNDPADQRVSDEAVKRTTNLTPTGVRQALNSTAIDFQRRIDSRTETITASTPKEPAKITTTETKLDGQPVVLPLTNDNQNPFEHNAGSPSGGIPDIIIVFNGTASYTTLVGTIGAPV